MKKMLAMLLVAAMLVMSGAAMAEEKVTIEFFNVKSEIVDIMNKIIDDFNAANPDIEVTQTQVPDASTVLQTRMQTNDMPDVFSHWATDPAFYAMIENGVVTDLTGSDAMANVKEDMLAETLYDGKAYAVPISMNTAGVFYNVDIFNQYGLEVPTTWDEFIAVCQTLKDNGVTPIAMYNQGGNAATIFDMMEINEVENYEEVTKQMFDGELTIDQVPGFRAMAEKLLEVYQYVQDDSFGTDYDGAVTMFSNGEAAMTINGIWIIPTVKANNPDLNFSCFALPADTAEGTRVVYQNDFCLAISESCENKEAAERFIAYVASYDAAQYYADNDGSPSYIKDVVASVEEAQPLLAYFDSADNVAIWPDQLWQAGISDDITGYCQELLLGDVTVDEFLTELGEVFVEH